MGKPGLRFLRWAEVKERSDIHTYEGTTEWGNHDLYPIDQKDKKFGYLAYASYWSTGGFALFTFTLGSGYIAVGLNAGETIGASLIGAIISSCIGYFGARPGQDYGIGYVCFQFIWYLSCYFSH
jgi:nucleobase:cation symporter-1, NCS1 family